MSNMEFVLRFTLSHPGLSTTIVGTSNPAHLAGNIAIAEKGRFLPTSTKRPRSASRSRRPDYQSQSTSRPACLERLPGEEGS